MRADAPILFCVVTWMDLYEGSPGDDAIGGGSFVDQEGFGYEMFNFRSFRGQFYGFVEPGGHISLERLGAGRSAESIDGVLVVFVAPSFGTSPYVIIGWYKNATVFRSIQEPPKGSGR